MTTERVMPPKRRVTLRPRGGMPLYIEPRWSSAWSKTEWTMFRATSIAEIEKLVGELQEAKDFHRCLGGTAIRRRVEQDLKRSKWGLVTAVLA
jgi:hypothetical protein